MPSINATAFDLVPTTLAVLLAWLRWEAPLVVEVVEPAELHEPWFVVVVAPDAARLPPRWANITLDSSITAKNETIVFTIPPFWILERAALRAEICTIGHR